MSTSTRGFVGGLGLVAAALVIAGCAAPVDATAGGGTTSEEAADESISLAEAEGDTGAVMTQWGDRSIALPGAEGDPVPFCDTVDWSPVTTVLEGSGIVETGRYQGTWSEMMPYHWPTTSYEPVGRVVVGSCDLSLSSASDPAYTLASVRTTVWVLSEGVDTPEFWLAWYYSTQIDTPSVPGLVPGSLESATSSYYLTDNPILFAVADNVMVEVASSTSSANAEARTPGDPPAEPLMAAFQTVAAQAITWSKGL